MKAPASEAQGAGTLDHLAGLAEAIRADALKADAMLVAIERICFYARHDGGREDFDAVRDLAKTLLDLAGETSDKAEAIRDALQAQACIARARG